MTQILTAIGGVSAILTVGYGVFKWVTWKTQKTPEQNSEEIEAEIQRKEDLARKTGRPQ